MKIKELIKEVFSPPAVEGEGAFAPINFMKDFFNAGRSNDRETTVHNVDPDQLYLGIQIEHEHTTHHLIAEKIALDHLAEIPDYYTRLRKMEEDAKKEQSK